MTQSSSSIVIALSATRYKSICAHMRKPGIYFYQKEQGLEINDPAMSARVKSPFGAAGSKIKKHKKTVDHNC